MMECESTHADGTRLGTQCSTIPYAHDVAPSICGSEQFENGDESVPGVMANEEDEELAESEEFDSEEEESDDDEYAENVVEDAFDLTKSHFFTCDGLAQAEDLKPAEVRFFLLTCNSKATDVLCPLYR